MDKRKIAITAICGAVGAGLGYVGYKKFGNRTEGDTADTNTNTLGTEADDLDREPENVFVPNAGVTDASTDVI